MSHISLFASSLRHPDKAHGATWEKDAARTSVQEVRSWIFEEKCDHGYRYWRTFERTVLDKGFRVNAWTGAIHLDGLSTSISREQLLGAFEDELEVTCMLTTEKWNRRFNILADQHTFNPIRAYLEGLAQKANEGYIPSFAEWDAERGHMSDRSEYLAYVRETKANASLKPIEPWDGWDTLAKDVFGVEDSLSQEMFTSWLIGAVARGVDPGCQMRQCLTLQGAQEIGKTQVLKALGGEYYSSRDSEMSDADVYRQLQGAWIMELEEVEAIASKRSVENLKRFISVQEDEYRHLYQNEIKKHPRHSVLAATANSTNFLRDEDNTRFWVIAIPGEIQVDYVRQYRDQIWLEAYRRYLDGQKPWTKELSRKASERAKEFTVTNDFTDLLEPILKELTANGEAIAIKGGDILEMVLRVPPAQHSKYQKKLGGAMRELGYEVDKCYLANSSERPRAYHKKGTKPTLITKQQLGCIMDRLRG